MKAFVGILGLLFSTGPVVPSYAGSENLTIVDVRTREEFEEGHIKGAINIDILKPDFESKIRQFDKTKIYKIYCRSGNRSGQATRIMSKFGFNNVENVGSLQQAARRLSRQCEGRTPC